MKIPEGTIEDIRRATDIVDVVSSYVQLKKRGKNYVGLCPFHSEKTPSFTVSADKQMFHCFGCGKGGNVYTFLMEIERMTFLEAVRSLAARAGISLAVESQEVSPESELRERLYKICHMAARWYYENLITTKEGEIALTYCRQRGLRDDTIQAFGLGYSPQSWDAFVQKATAEGISPEDLVAAGLARKREDGSLYDTFRGRLMFPIIAPNGKFVAFGARKLREDDPIAGKYINSPETPIYNKSQILYGLFQAKEAIRKEDAALLVEGYMDLLALVQAGVHNVVASSGTALTEQQLLLLSRYTRNVFLVYDADTAGSSATVRGIDLALEKNFEVHVVPLPENEDPDSFVRKNGAAAFQERLKEAVPWIEFKAQQLFETSKLLTPEGKAQAIRAFISTIAKIPDDLRRTLYIKDIAERYNVYESILHRELENVLRKNTTSTRMSFKKNTAPEKTEEGKKSTPSTPSLLPPEERDLLKVILEGNHRVHQFVLSYVDKNRIRNVYVRNTLEILENINDEQENHIAHWLLETTTDPQFKALLSEVMLTRYSLSHGWKEMEKEIDEPDVMVLARDVVVALHRRCVQEDIEANKAALKEATLAGESAFPFLQRQQQLLELLKQIDSDNYLKIEI